MSVDLERQEEIASLRGTVRDACGKLGGTAVARGLPADGPGFDEGAWEVLGAQVGLACLGLPERAGGVGGLPELTAAAEELGASLLPVPFLSSTVLAGQVLAHVGETEAAATARSGRAGVAASSRPPGGRAESGGAGRSLPPVEAGRSLPPVEASQKALARSGWGDRRSLPPAEGARVALSELAEGAVVGLAALDRDGLWRPDRLETTFRAAGDGGWLVDGLAPFVLDGAGARMFVVAARPATAQLAGRVAGADLFLVDAAGTGVDIGRLETLDLTRAQASVTFTAAAATPLTRGGTAGDAIAPALDVAGVVLAAEQLGGAQACLDMTVAYVRERRQFGRPIGGFQAVKHLCADLLVQVEMCRSAVDSALSAEDTPVFAEASAVAQAWCSDAFRTVSAEAVQLHGGIGFTWEHDAHLYFRRARADAVLLGGSAHHRERLATILGW